MHRRSLTLWQKHPNLLASENLRPLTALPSGQGCPSRHTGMIGQRLGRIFAQALPIHTMLSLSIHTYGCMRVRTIWPLIDLSASDQRRRTASHHMPDYSAHECVEARANQPRGRPRTAISYLQVPLR